VFNVGGLGLDSINRLKLLSRAQLKASLGFEFCARNLLVTFHPPTLEFCPPDRQMRELLAALHSLRETAIIFTMPNADAGNRELAALINEFVASHPNARAFTSLGQLRYLSCLNEVDGVVGNSSSGLIEAPVNIGDRQRGRLRAGSVLDCPPDRDAIAAAIKKLYSPAFQARLATVRNPYGNGGASDEIVRTIAAIPLDGVLKKQFYDLPATGTHSMTDKEVQA
jgi:GDP/UDP-N,N'-diacetylbacillosamine 2-epimerase (hydrolysing)